MSDTFCPVTFCVVAILFVQLLFVLQSCVQSPITNLFVNLLTFCGSEYIPLCELHVYQL